MASIANTLSTISGDLKKSYAPKMVKAVPTQCLYQRYDPDDKEGKELPLKIRFADVDRLGDTFQISTKVQSGQGVSYNGAGGAVVDLQDALSMIIVQQAVIGYEIVNRQQMSYSAAFAGDAAGEKAIKVTAQLMLEDLKDVAYSRNEMSGLFGQNADTGYGQIKSQTYSNPTLTVVFTDASFSPGWWAGLQGARIQFYTQSTLVENMGGDATRYGTVATVNVATKTVTFTLSSNWATSTSVPAATAIVAPIGALTSGGTWNEQIGLYTQLTATSGTVFGQNRATYSMLQGSTFSAGSARLTKAKVISASMNPINKGQKNDLVLVCSTATWSDLAQEDIAQRIYDSSYSGSVSKSGSRSMTYETQNATIKVVPHTYMQGGIAFLHSEEEVYWVGSTDVTFKLPNGEDLFLLVSGKNAYESQCVSNKQIVCELAGHQVVINNIVNSTDVNP